MERIENNTVVATVTGKMAIADYERIKPFPKEAWTYELSGEYIVPKKAIGEWVDESDGTFIFDKQYDIGGTVYKTLIKADGFKTNAFKHLVFNCKFDADLKELFEGNIFLRSVDFSGADMEDVTEMDGCFNNCSKLKEVIFSSERGTANLRNLVSMYCAFAECTKLKEIDFTGVNLTSLSNLSKAFVDCSKLEAIKFGDNNMQNVEQAYQMFKSCEDLKAVTLGEAEFSKCQDFAEMFDGCKELTGVNLSHFSPSNTITCESMFRGCKRLCRIDISCFEGAEITNMCEMFFGCKRLNDVDFGCINLAQVNCLGIFGDCENLGSYVSGEGWFCSAIPGCPGKFITVEPV
jgi:uncharacterized protein YjbI with pentapeptide repeats